MADKALQDLVSRLEAERLAADRRYNDALTDLDRAVQALSPSSSGNQPVGYDPSQLPRVNQHWQILKRGPEKGLRGFILRVVEPILKQQQAFNAGLVDHLNRNVASHAEAVAAVEELRRALAADNAAREALFGSLIAFLQTITEYVDTKDRALGGPELREQIVLANERALALKRELADRPPSSALRAPEGRETRGQRPEGLPGPATDFSYVGFEDRFRGSQETIRRRLEDYVPLFQGASGGDVLDVGCGRGELLALLGEAGISARGIDVNGEMVALCRERGFKAEQADALTHLDSLPDSSLAGLSAIQVVEHLEPGYLARVIEAAFHKLRPGAPILLETINPACWMAFFEAYIRDLTHAQPIHPDTLRFLVQASGFSAVDVQFRSPVAESDRLDRVDGAAVPSHAPAALRDAIAAVNAHADKLNARLFSYMDYVVLARR